MENYKCRQNTVHIRVLKKTRDSLRKIVAKEKTTIQEYLDKLTTAIKGGL